MGSNLRSLALLLTAVLLGAFLAPHRVEAGAFAPPPRDVRVVKKTSSTSRSSTTSQTADPTLTYAVAASTNYRFRFTIFYTCGTTGNIAGSVTAPSSPTLFHGFRVTSSAGGAASLSGTLDTGGDYSTTAGTLIFEGILQNGSNAGNIAWTWAQNASDSTATVVRAGSTLEVWVMQ